MVTKGIGITGSLKALVASKVGFALTSSILTAGTVLGIMGISSAAKTNSPGSKVTTPTLYPTLTPTPTVTSTITSIPTLVITPTSTQMNQPTTLTLKTSQYECSTEIYTSCNKIIELKDMAGRKLTISFIDQMPACESTVNQKDVTAEGTKIVTADNRKV